MTGICFWTGLTPELSRTDLRPRQWFNLNAISAAAKRARLERIVRPPHLHLGDPRCNCYQPFKTLDKKTRLVAGLSFVVSHRRWCRYSTFCKWWWCVRVRSGMALLALWGVVAVGKQEPVAMFAAGRLRKDKLVAALHSSHLLHSQNS